MLCRSTSSSESCCKPFGLGRPFSSRPVSLHAPPVHHAFHFPCSSCFRYFECNYSGFSAGFLDLWFGTFMARFKESSVEDVKQRKDAKAKIDGTVTTEYVVYLSLSTACMAVWAYYACAGVAVSTSFAVLLAFLASTGPTVLACVMSMYSSKQGGTAALFGKSKFMQTLVQLGLGCLVCPFPIFLATYWCLTRA